LTTWIVGSLRAIFQLDGQTVIRTIDALHARVFTFSDAGFLRAAAVAQHIPDVVAFGPCAIRSGEVLTWHKDVDAMLVARDDTLGLQFRMDRLIDFGA
jgi:hypothetical protein